MMLKIALVQMNVAEDKEVNLKEAETQIAKAAQAGAQIVVLPEIFNSPYDAKCFPINSEPAGGESWQRMSAAARENDVYLVAGSIPETDGDKRYNTCFVFDRTGKQIARHRKVHLFDVDVKGGQRFFESESFSPGSDITVFDTEYGRMGVCICFDIRFPEIARLTALEGARIIFYPAAFNMTTGPAHWETSFRMRALDNQVFTVGVAPARNTEASYVAYGNSIVCSPWGDVAYRAGFEPELLIADIDMDKVDEIRAQLPLLSARRTDLYSIHKV